MERVGSLWSYDKGKEEFSFDNGVQYVICKCLADEWTAVLTGPSLQIRREELVLNI